MSSRASRRATPMRIPHHIVHQPTGAVAARAVIIVAVAVLTACGDTDPDRAPDASADGTSQDDVGLDDLGRPDAATDTSDGDTDSLDGSDGALDADAATPDWCEGATAHVYAPFESTEVDLFPDGLMVREDATSLTGERLDYAPERVSWIAAAPQPVQRATAGLNVLSGFGGLGGAVLRFSSPVAPISDGAQESVSNPGWIWADLGTEPPTRIPYDAWYFDDGATVVLWPMVPLRLGTEHAIVVTTDAVDASGACMSPAPATRSLLFGDGDEGEFGDRYARVRPRYRAAVSSLGLSPAEISAITVYGTHDDLGPMRRAAARMQEEPVEWGTWGGCTERQTMFQCDTSTTVLDMRNELGLVDDELSPVEAEVPVMVWLPADAEGPVPVLVFGHGLQSDRDDGWEVARRVQDDGVAVISMPAVEHGEHPSVTEDDLPQSLLRFLALDPERLSVDALKLRGNMNQTNLDRLRLIHLLRTRPDLDGDGTDDIDPERITYIGASLGATLGPGLLALSPDLDAAVLTVGGARLVSLVRDQEELLDEYAPFMELVIGPGQLDLLLPIAQHAVDPADPGTWASHVLRDRFDGRVPPSVLFTVGMEDEVFSPDSGATLARALGVPHIAPIAAPVPLVESGGAAPVAANFADGARTIGFFQYDRVTQGEDETPRHPRHGESARSNESGVQLRAFFQAWSETGLPEIIDPFELLGTAPRPEDW